ncbi:MAG: 50S ribosomal protein L21 [Actinomycetota bacterium]
MYAVIKTGGKQYRVAAGDVIEVEHLRRSSEDEALNLSPLLVVTDDGKTVHGAEALADYRVGGKVVGEAKGDKITVFKYRNKSGYARKTGHRQLYSRIEITSIDGGKSSAAKAPAEKAATGKTSQKAKTAEKQSPAKSSAAETPAKAAPKKATAGKADSAKKAEGTKQPAKPAKKAPSSGGGQAAGSDSANVSSDGS